jgi:twitching motility protein PilT
MATFDLDSLLAEGVRLGASDLHLKVPAPPRVRIHGELVELEGAPAMAAEAAGEIKERVLTSEVKRRQFEERGSADFSYYTDAGRFRVSAFSQRGCASFVFRVIPAAPEAESLGLPEKVLSWADAKRGLIVITGPTGSGKTTTTAAIIDLINSRRPGHILTIEDPIEYLHADRKAMVCQREIGLDVPTYDVALRAALRQDPDVIVIGEVRDEETAMTALRAAETGHLVLCTMHTLNASKTVERFIDLFGERQVSLARQMLSSTLVGVCSQRLLPGAEGGRVLNTEVLVSSGRIRDLMSHGAPQAELQEAIGDGEYYGMRTFDQDLIEKVAAGLVTAADAVAFASHEHDFKLALAAAGHL